MSARSSAPSYQTDVFRERQAASEKEVSPFTLLTDEALRPIRREHTPDWVGHSLSKQDGWKHRSDPRLDRSLEVYYTEPNWKRNVDQRKSAWERKAFETEQKLNRPMEAKVPSQGPPYWASHADAKHSVWQAAAEDLGRGGGGGSGYASQQNYYKPQLGSGTHVYQNGHVPSGGVGVQRHDYSQSDSSRQQQSQPISLGYGGGGNQAVSMHSPGGYSVHTSTQTGDRNTGNYATSEHFEKEQRDPNRFEKSSYTHSESKSTTVNGQPAASLPAGSSLFSQHSPASAYNNNQQNFSSYNANNSNQTTRTTTTKSPLLDHRPLGTHHVANGVETDILNRGYNSNQAQYFFEKHAAPTPHHHHSPAPQTTVHTTTTSTPIGGGHRYANFSSESSGQPGGPNYSTHESYSSEQRDPSGRGYQTSSFTKSEQRSTTTGGGAPVSLGWTSAPQNQSSSHNQQYSSESNKRSETTTTQPTRTTTYSYAQQPLVGSQTPGDTRYEHYSMNRREEKREETKQPVVVAAPQETRYETYSMKRREERKEETTPIALPPPVQETRYERYSSNRREETKTEESRPVSQASQYSEQRNFEKSSNQKTTTTNTSSSAPHVLSSTATSNDAFDRKAEMAESLPKGTISNTLNNTEGGYRDPKGHDVSYKRELSTSADPGREVALLKEEEKRVIEKPLEPGVISRHVTTKYYKKKTTTDTTTTTNPVN